MTTDASRPSYLGLLNAISVAEADAECYLGAWASTTPRADVKSVIATIALREGEHAKAFAKRICELGYEVRPRTDPDLARKLDIASSTTLSDRDKFEQLGLGSPADPGTPDIFAGMLADQSIDIATGALLGRYIAEERDSGRLFAACYQQLCDEQDGGGSGAVAEEEKAVKKPSKSQRLADIEARMARLERKLDQVVNR